MMNREYERRDEGKIIIVNNLRFSCLKVAVLCNEWYICIKEKTILTLK